MQAELRQQKEIILYWFQSYDLANADTLSQKLSLLWKKTAGKKEDNAFVRITVPLEENSIETAQMLYDLNPEVVLSVSIRNNKEFERAAQSGRQGTAGK